MKIHRDTLHTVTHTYSLYDLETVPLESLIKFGINVLTPLELIGISQTYHDCFQSVSPTGTL